MPRHTSPKKHPALTFLFYRSRDQLHYFFVIDKKRIHLQYLFLKIKIKDSMEQQNNTNNNSNTLMYLGIGSGILIVLLIAYLAWPNSSAKKEEEGSSSKDKTVQQKTTTTAIKGATQTASYQTTLEKEKNKIRKDLGSMVNYKFGWSTSIRNHFIPKIIFTLFAHCCMGYYFQVPAETTEKNFWLCWYISKNKGFDVLNNEILSATQLAVVCTIIQFSVSLGFFAMLSYLARKFGFVNSPMEKIKAAAIEQEGFTLKKQAEGAQSQGFLKRCRKAKKGFEPIYKTAKAAFDKEKAVLDKKAATIPSVEKLEKAIKAAKSTAEKAANANEVKKQEGKLAILGQKLAYANAVAANNKIKKDKKATEQQKKEAAQKVKNAKDGLKTPEYKAAAVAFKGPKEHKAFLEDAIDTMKILIKKAKKAQTSVQQEVAKVN